MIHDPLRIGFQFGGGHVKGEGNLQESQVLHDAVVKPVLEYAGLAIFLAVKFQGLKAQLGISSGQFGQRMVQGRAHAPSRSVAGSRGMPSSLIA